MPVAVRLRNWSALPLLVLVLSLAVMFGPGTPNARADVGWIPVSIGEDLAAGGEVVGEGAAGGGCVASIVCVLGVGAVGAGMVLYATHDSWMPVASDAWHAMIGGGDDPAAGGSASGTGLCFSMGGATISANSLAGNVNIQDCPYNGTNLAVYAWNTECQASDGSVHWVNPGRPQDPSGTGSQHLDVPKNQSNPWTQSWDFSFPVCGSAEKLISTSYYVGGSWSGWVNTAPHVIGAPIDAANWSQTTTVTCQHPDGTTSDLVGTQMGHPEEVVVPSCWQAAPGSIPVHIGITGGLPGAEQTVANQDLINPHQNYPQCFDAGGAFLSGTCRIRVWVDGSPCHVGDPGCTSWMQLLDTAPSRVTCHWGPYQVAMADCYPLRNSYKLDVQTQTFTQTCQSMPNGCDPSSDPSTGTGTTPMPLEGANPDPGDGNGSCMGSAWSWNPIKWIYIPVKCALQWAFVPSTSLQTRVQAVTASFSGKIPFVWVDDIGTSVGAWGGAAGAGDSCPDWRVKVDGYGAYNNGVPPGHVDQNVVCDSTFTTSIRTARPWLAGAMIALAVWPFIRSIFYASVPVIKPTPSSGGD